MTHGLQQQSLRVSIAQRKRIDMNQLIKSLPTVLKAAGSSAEVAEAAAIAAWRHACGDGLKEHAVALKLENRTLTVAVADPIWKKQLNSMRSQLLYRINSVLGQSLVNAFDFVIDPKLTRPRVEQQRPDEEPLDNEVPLELWSAANTIHDKELRKSFLKTALRALKRKR
jgi:predicted nucleic acid-binding Zn ribbon protein